jgi:hypothetical protein
MACCAGLALGFIPFGLTYWSAIAANHGWEFSQFLANAMGMKDVLDTGAGNLIWGQVFHLSGASVMTYGVPPIMALLFTGTMVWLLRLRARGSSSRLHCALLASGLATILLLSTTIKYHEMLFWYYPWRWLPGARTVRVLPRVFLVATLFITIVSIGGLDELMRRAQLAGMRRAQVGGMRPKLGRALLALAVAAIVVEQVNLASVHGISRQSENARLGTMPPAPSSCRSMFLEPSKSSAHPISLQVDAMFLAQRNNLPTVNGYSGLQPESWRLNIPQSPDYLRNLDDWLDRNGIAKESCGADIDSSVWLVTGRDNRER